MDLFHSITQGIDKVLTCHWYDELKNFKSPHPKTITASDNTMDTERGGEQTQYEGAVTENVPPSTQRGQLGTGPNTKEAGNPLSADRAQKTTENIRYGQNISESGMGGMTTTTTGQASQGGFGGAEANKDETKPAQTRREQGYGPGNGVGA